ncbi:unnamed protein product [Notodromas monacha]|uniref:Peptidase S1 domain-containing protein n=1 Tax=Notodromas monacha TaxID=399045 RepID=A0A7R9BMN1_9CRUS|nr:unnamed protein product [Notodromas monacha]CAG0917483.1 unnamed protein product [Notodromas monacha]
MRSIVPLLFLLPAAVVAQTPKTCPNPFSCVYSHECQKPCPPGFHHQPHAGCYQILSPLQCNAAGGLVATLETHKEFAYMAAMLVRASQQNISEILVGSDKETSASWCVSTAADRPPSVKPCDKDSKNGLCKISFGEAHCDAVGTECCFEVKRPTTTTSRRGTPECEICWHRNATLSQELLHQGWTCAEQKFVKAVNVLERGLTPPEAFNLITKTICPPNTSALCSLIRISSQTQHVLLADTLKGAFKINPLSNSLTLASHYSKQFDPFKEDLKLMCKGASCEEVTLEIQPLNSKSKLLVAESHCESFNSMENNVIPKQAPAGVAPAQSEPWKPPAEPRISNQDPFRYEPPTQIPRPPPQEQDFDSMESSMPKSLNMIPNEEEKRPQIAKPLVKQKARKLKTKVKKMKKTKSNSNQRDLTNPKIIPTMGRNVDHVEKLLDFPRNQQPAADPLFRPPGIWGPPPQFKPQAQRPAVCGVSVSPEATQSKRDIWARFGRDDGLDSEDGETDCNRFQANPELFPWHMSIYYVASNGSRMFMCSGIHIGGDQHHHHHMLATAECAERIPPGHVSNIKALPGIHSEGEITPSTLVQKGLTLIDVHTHYAFDSNAAIFTFATHHHRHQRQPPASADPTMDFAPICLPPPGDFFWSPCYIMGWSTSESGNKLIKLDVNVAFSKKCKHHNMDTKICIEFNAESDTCLHDMSPVLVCQRTVHQQQWRHPNRIAPVRRQEDIQKRLINDVKMQGGPIRPPPPPPPMPPAGVKPMRTPWVNDDVLKMLNGLPMNQLQVLQNLIIQKLITKLQKFSETDSSTKQILEKVDNLLANFHKTDDDVDGAAAADAELDDYEDADVEENELNYQNKRFATISLLEPSGIHKLLKILFETPGAEKIRDDLENIINTIEDMVPEEKELKKRFAKPPMPFKPKLFFSALPNSHFVLAIGSRVGSSQKKKCIKGEAILMTRVGSLMDFLLSIA